MSESINWCELESQFFSSSVFRKKLAKMVNVVDGLDEAFVAGKHFVKNYDNTNTNLDNDLKLIANNINYSSSSNGSNDDSSKMQPSTDRMSEIYRKIEELNREIIESDQSTLDDEYNAEEIAKLKLEPIDTTKIKWWEREALQFMRGMMDECTHLKNFSVPYDTSLITAVCAKDDAYVPREGKIELILRLGSPLNVVMVMCVLILLKFCSIPAGCSSLEDIWPGSEVKYIDAGHVSAYVLYQKLIRYEPHSLRNMKIHIFRYLINFLFSCFISEQVS